MARKVKLQDRDGEYSTADIAYRASNGKYYSSEEAYNKIALNSEYRTRCINKMFNVLGYKQGMKIPTFFYKKLKDWEFYGYDVIFECMCDNDNVFDWALKNKPLNQETAKVMYICAIIENNLTDTYKRMLAEKKQTAKFKKKDSELINTSVVIHKQKSKDISKFLEDDE